MKTLSILLFFSSFSNFFTLTNLNASDNSRTFSEYFIVESIFDDATNPIGYRIFYIGNSIINGALEIPNYFQGTNGNLPILEIGDYAFSNTSLLTSITIPDTVIKIGIGAFSNCIGITNIIIPQSVTTIGEHAFYKCNKIKNISMSANVLSIGQYAFAECSSLENIKLSKSLTAIEDFLFYNCSALLSLSIPEGVNVIGKNAFMNCSALFSINIPGGVEIIEDFSFADCDALKSVTIPKSVNRIGQYAFSHAFVLRSVYFEGAAPTMDLNVFSSLSESFTIYVLETHLASYEALNLGYTLATYVPEVDADVFYTVIASFDNENNRFILISKNEDNGLNTLVQYTDDLAGDQWTTLSSLNYLEATSSADNTVTRTLSNVDPAVQAKRFYRLHSDL